MGGRLDQVSNKILFDKFGAEEVMGGGWLGQVRLEIK